MRIEDLKAIEYDLGIPPVFNGRLLVDGIEEITKDEWPLKLYLQSMANYNPTLVLANRDPEWWAIRGGCSRCLNKKTGIFDYEPSPSSRDKKFLKSHRFKTAQSALEYYVDWCERQKESHATRNKSGI